MLNDTESYAGLPKRKHTEPHADFDYATVAENLGETEPQPLPENDRADLALALSQMFDWLLAVDLKRASSVELVGRRVIALAWVMDCERFDGGSLTKLAGQLGITAAQLSELTADASRRFGISNSFQEHDSKGEK